MARSMTDRIWTAALAVIGDEILSGRTQDRNVAQLATWLNVQGIRLAEVRIVPDVEAAIVEAVTELRARNDYLFTTGGIGPTHDDITVDAIAAALGVAVTIHPEARDALERHYASRGGLTEARLRMARVPAGADLIVNHMSGAPGIRAGNIFVLAGVPHIAAGMLASLTGTLEGGRPVVSATIGAGCRKARLPTCCVRPSARRPAMRAAGWRSAATPSSARVGSAPISSAARPIRRWSTPASPTSPGA